jgi:hypothetical protein
MGTGNLERLRYSARLHALNVSTDVIIPATLPEARQTRPGNLEKT